MARRRSERPSDTAARARPSPTMLLSTTEERDTETSEYTSRSRACAGTETRLGAECVVQCAVHRIDHHERCIARGPLEATDEFGVFFGIDSKPGRGRQQNQGWSLRLALRFDPMVLRCPACGPCKHWLALVPLLLPAASFGRKLHT